MKYAIIDNDWFGLDVEYDTKTDAEYAMALAGSCEKDLLIVQLLNKEESEKEWGVE